MKCTVTDTQDDIPQLMYHCIISLGQCQRWNLAFQDSVQLPQLQGFYFFYPLLQSSLALCCRAQCRSSTGKSPSVLEPEQSERTVICLYRNCKDSIMDKGITFALKQKSTKSTRNALIHVLRTHRFKNCYCAYNLVWFSLQQVLQNGGCNILRSTRKRNASIDSLPNSQILHEWQIAKRKDD